MELVLGSTFRGRYEIQRTTNQVDEMAW